MEPTVLVMILTRAVIVRIEKMAITAAIVRMVLIVIMVILVILVIITGCRV